VIRVGKIKVSEIGWPTNDGTSANALNLNELSVARRPVCTENLNPNVAVMKPAKNRV
jgi:hypothetical protein